MSSCLDPSQQHMLEGHWWGNRKGTQVPLLEYALSSFVWMNPFTWRINPNIIKDK